MAEEEAAERLPRPRRPSDRRPEAGPSRPRTPGALLVGIILSGLHRKTEKDPRTVLAGLAGLVLSRIPDVGRTDTGKLSQARFSVAGEGRAQQIIYFDPSTNKSVTLKNVKPPRHVESRSSRPASRS